MKFLKIYARRKENETRVPCERVHEELMEQLKFLQEGLPPAGLAHRVAALPAPERVLREAPARVLRAARVAAEAPLQLTCGSLFRVVLDCSGLFRVCFHMFWVCLWFVSGCVQGFCLGSFLNVRGCANWPPRHPRTSSGVPP